MSYELPGRGEGLASCYEHEQEQSPVLKSLEQGQISADVEEAMSILGEQLDSSGHQRAGLR